MLTEPREKHLTEVKEEVLTLQGKNCLTFAHIPLSHHDTRPDPCHISVTSARYIRTVAVAGRFRTVFHGSEYMNSK